VPTRKSIVGAGSEVASNQPPGRRFASVFLAALLGGWLMSMHLPVVLVLPAMSVLMVGSGLIMAAILYLSGSRMGIGSSAAWEVAGALVFLGCGAAIVTDNHQALVLFDQMGTRGLAALGE